MSMRPSLDAMPGYQVQRLADKGAYMGGRYVFRHQLFSFLRRCMHLHLFVTRRPPPLDKQFIHALPHSSRRCLCRSNPPPTHTHTQKAPAHTPLPPLWVSQSPEAYFAHTPELKALHLSLASCFVVLEEESSTPSAYACAEHIVSESATFVRVLEIARSSYSQRPAGTLFSTPTVISCCSDGLSRKLLRLRVRRWLADASSFSLGGRIRHGFGSYFKRSYDRSTRLEHPG
eukprot:6179829-Pleurochrysis_carterae.AAC.2